MRVWGVHSFSCHSNNTLQRRRPTKQKAKSSRAAAGETTRCWKQAEWPSVTARPSEELDLTFTLPVNPPYPPPGPQPGCLSLRVQEPPPPTPPLPVTVLSFFHTPSASEIPAPAFHPSGRGGVEERGEREGGGLSLSSTCADKMSDDECRSPIGLDCCSCCLDLANGCDDSIGGPPGSPTSPIVNHFRRLRSQLMYQNTDKLNNIMRQDSLESVVRDPCFLLNEGICNGNIDQTMLSILVFFHSASGASVVAIDNKIEQAMDLVKNHLMYAVREEVEVLKEQIKELAEKNNQLERENYLLKNLASPEQLEKFQSRIPADALLPLDNRSAQVTPEHLLQPCSLSTGSAV
ncbi:TSC22 domain family protein 3 isoform X1 [Pungitius pungitius]|uniref:TSC22 domain family protein 3 isoform X1 n=1 Tax=Pungitius pungitius TaxID=134920 RepID=UPI0018872340|nr:TSC22 domain family protein 3 isoform X1 [Pungitius pungitius]